MHEKQPVKRRALGVLLRVASIMLFVSLGNAQTQGNPICWPSGVITETWTPTSVLTSVSVQFTITTACADGSTADEVWEKNVETQQFLVTKVVEQVNLFGGSCLPITEYTFEDITYVRDRALISKEFCPGDTGCCELVSSTKEVVGQVAREGAPYLAALPCPWGGWAGILVYPWYLDLTIETTYEYQAIGPGCSGGEVCATTTTTSVETIPNGSRSEVVFQCE